MKLTYRGVSYDRAPASLEVTEGDILGKYRGQLTRCHKATQPLERPDVESMLLHYRGGLYSAMKPAVAGSMKQPRVLQAPAASCPIRLPQLSKLMNQDVRQVHLENMRRSLEQRIQSAQAKGDQHLVKILRQESNNLRMSH